MTRKYDSRTKANMAMGEGMATHDGFFNFNFGISRTKKGMLYRTSSIASRSP